jgi:hypothetical protein
MYALLALLNAPTGLQLNALAMVYFDCLGRHYDCGSDDLSGMDLLPSDLLAYRPSVFLAYTKTWERKSILKLRFTTGGAAHCRNKHLN